MEIAIEKRSRLDRKASQKSARKMPPLTIKSIKCKASNQREGDTIFKALGFKIQPGKTRPFTEPLFTHLKTKLKFDI